MATGLILVFGVLVLLYLLITLGGNIFTSVDRKKRRACSKKEAAPARQSGA
ncbi:MAG: OadG family transporter subunit [Ruthenibacterium lactatiformans]